MKFDKFKLNFQTLNDFRCKSGEDKSCSTHQDLQLLFWSSYHLTKFEPFKFEILKNDKFEPKFETQNDFNIKSDEYVKVMNTKVVQLIKIYNFYFGHLII